MPDRTGLLSTRQRDAIALTIVALVFAVPLRGLLRAPGPPMEEGFMLVFPERVLHGAIPNRDFLHLYGPGSVWALAGAFKVFGVSLLTERLFGLAQQMAIVFGIYALARRWGRTVAVSGAVTSALIIIPFGLTALAWIGGVVHSIGEGTDAGQTWFLAMLAIVVVPTLALLVARLAGVRRRVPVRPPRPVVSQ